MNIKIKEKLVGLKNGKLIFILGICGILLIFVSSFFSSSNNDKKTDCEAFDIETYQQNIEKSIQNVVKNISGAKKVSVMVTLDTGVTYTFADETKFNKSDRQSGNSTDVSTDSENKYIIITDADGNEKPLVISEQLPIVRGVAVIYSGSGSAYVKEQIERALVATLGITTKRIYITDTGGY